MKQLFLVRHAKAASENPMLPDHDRQLTDEGREQAEKLALRLKKAEVKPSMILCSSAIRAQETARLLMEGLGLPATKIIVNPELYQEDLEQLIEVIKQIPATDTQVMIVAHNPTLSWLASYLSNDLQINLSPCGLFAMRFEMPTWGKITEVVGQVISL